MRVKLQSLPQPSLAGLYRRSNIEWTPASIFRMSWCDNIGNIRDFFLSCFPIDTNDGQEIIVVDPSLARLLGISENQVVTNTLT